MSGLLRYANPPPALPPMAVPPSPYRPWIVGLGVAFGVFAGVNVIYRLSQIQRPDDLDAPEEPPWPPGPGPVIPPDPDAPEPWEIEAEAGGPVDPHIDEHVSEPIDTKLIVGEGLPDELCHKAAEGTLGGDPSGVICVIDPLADPDYAPRASAAPMAATHDDAIWPIGEDGTHKRRLAVSYWTEKGIRGKWGRYFGADRGSRKHSGIDIFANVGDPVRAPQDGRVIAILPFTKGTWAVYVKLRDGQVANLGEIAKRSWREFKIKPGMEVERGTPVARVGLADDGAHMLHFELYDGGAVDDATLVEQIRQGKMQWPREAAPPELLLDPSAYLVDASARTYRAELAGA